MQRRSKLSNESEAHKALKRIAHSELKKAGFGEGEIKEEYPVDIDGHRFIVDVVGVRENKAIAYECGGVQRYKLDKLKTFFDKVVWIPYLLKVSKDGEKRRSKNIIIHKRTGAISGLRKLRKFGDSYYLNVPKEFIEQHGLKAGDPLSLGANHILKYMPVQEK